MYWALVIFTARMCKPSVARYALITIVSFTRWSRTHLGEPDSRRSACACDLAPLQFTLPAVCDAFVCHSQLVPQTSPRSAQHWSSYSLGVHGPQVLLSQPQLFSQSVHRTAAGFY